MQNLIGNEDFEAKVIELLEKTKMYVTVRFVADSLRVNWATARAVLLALAAEGRIAGLKTTRSWIFSKKVNKTN